jgi:hypothetical protein
MLKRPDSGSLYNTGRVRKFPVFPGPAKANVSDRSTLVPERRCRQGQNARSPFIKVNVKQPGTFGNAAGFFGVSTKEEDT